MFFSLHTCTVLSTVDRIWLKLMYVLFECMCVSDMYTYDSYHTHMTCVVPYNTHTGVHAANQLPFPQHNTVFVVPLFLLHC